MTRKQKKRLFRIIVSAVLLLAVLIPDKAGAFPDLPWFVWLLLYLVPYFLIGYDVLLTAFKNIGHGQVFSEKFLMTVATLGALAIGFFPDMEPEYAEAVFVMLFYQVGEFFQSIAVGKSRKNIASLMDIRPDSANLLLEDGSFEQTDPDEIQIGQVIVVRPGEKIPLDGVVLQGQSTVDTSALTGESRPQQVRESDPVLSGSINQTGLLHVRVTKTFGQSTVSKILELVENASSNKSKSENFITKFARWYTPVVVFSALALAILPPLVILAAGNAPVWGDWIKRALTFLVVSCPCALVISIPLSYFGGIGGASAKGILVKGSNHLEDLASASVLCIDKTGTLTKGNFAVDALHPEGIDEERFLYYAAHAEASSSHPIALAFRQAYGKEPEARDVQSMEDVTTAHARGIRAQVAGHAVLIGNADLMAEAGLTPAEPVECGSVAHMAVDGVYAGYAVIRDELKPEAAQVVNELHELGVRPVVMLTGDREETAADVAQKTGVDAYRAQLLPEDKVRALTEEMERMKEKNPRGKLLFAGDGVNDAPVITRADVGIAMGALGSDAAIEAADIVLMNDSLSQLVKAIRIARFTRRIVWENVVFALGVKFAVLLLTALGFGQMWMAIFADVGVCVLAVLNAMRTLHYSSKKA